MTMGVEQDVIFDYYVGWSFDRLYRLFLQLQRKQIEDRRQHAVSVAVGAANLFSRGKALEAYSEGVDRALSRLDDKAQEADTESDNMAKVIERNKKVKNELNKLFPFLSK